MAWAKVTENEVDYAQKDGAGKLYTQAELTDEVNALTEWDAYADGQIVYLNNKITQINDRKALNADSKADYEAGLAVFS